MSDYEFINVKKSSKLGSGAKTLVSGSNKKKKSLRQQTNYGTGKNNKQSPGFLEMVVSYVKEKLS